MHHNIINSNEKIKSKRCQKSRGEEGRQIHPYCTCRNDKKAHHKFEKIQTRSLYLVTWLWPSKSHIWNKNHFLTNSSWSFWENHWHLWGYISGVKFPRYNSWLISITDNKECLPNQGNWPQYWCGLEFSSSTDPKKLFFIIQSTLLWQPFTSFMLIKTEVY